MPPTDRCAVCDRPHADSLPAPAGTCGRQAGYPVLEDEALKGRIGDDEILPQARPAWNACRNCRAHAVDWRPRCLAAEALLREADLLVLALGRWRPETLPLVDSMRARIRAHLEGR